MPSNIFIDGNKIETRHGKKSIFDYKKLDYGFGLVTEEDAICIAALYQLLNKDGHASIKDVADMTGWSETTVRKYCKTEVPNYIKNNIQDTKEFAGLYLIGNIILNDNGEIEYLLKVGKSHNVQKRLGDYWGMNPSVKIIDTIPIAKNKLSQLELTCHKILDKFSIERYGKTEWFKVSKELYQEISKNKFKFFLI